VTDLPPDTVARWSAEIADVGYSVVPGVFTAGEVATLRDALSQVFERERAVAAERGWANDVYHVAYMLPAKSRPLLEVSWHPRSLALAGAVLGGDCVLAALNGFTPTPRGRAQRLHQDQPAVAPSLTVQLHVVCVLDAFTEENGATRVVPGSHRWPALPPDDTAEQRAVPIVAEVGSVVGYDAALWHASGANRTSLPRRALHAYYTRPWVVPHWDVPASLPAEVAASLTEEQRRVLGFEVRPKRYDYGRNRIER
jgi:hypothetical protein